MKIKIKLLFFLLIVQFAVYAQEGFFSSKLPRNILDEWIVLPGSFNPIPKCGDKCWDQIPPGVKSAYIEEAEKYLNTALETVTATEFMEYQITGNRMNYEFKLFDQRSRLEFAVIAELLENKGRFTDEIIDGVWKICEETWWGVPAHYNKGGTLPDQETVMFIDLFFSETAQMLSWVYYLMKDKMDEKSPVVSKRLKSELQSRMLDACLDNDYWWKRNTINWGTWITSNWLTSVLLIETDRDKQLDAIQQILQTMDGFYREYPEDGGCDEGPGYWNRAAGSLFESLDLLSIASNKKIDFSSDTKIRLMGAYYWKMYIGNYFFVNFADARPLIIPNVSIVYRYGRYIKDDKLINLARFVAKNENYQHSVIPNQNYIKYNDRPFLYGFGRQLFLLTMLDKVIEGESAPPLVKHTWQENLQIFTVRHKENSTDGLYFAAKGGHNAESHNHNDVGTFTLYGDGQPLLVDLGVEQYTKRTFGSNRYDLWTMQSAYHNLPTINGIMQKEGQDFKATNVKHKVNKKEYSFSLDISKAYPKEAKVNYWNRTMSLGKSGKFKVTEDFSLKENMDSTFISLMIYAKVDIGSEGEIILTSYKGKKYRIKYDSSLLRPQQEFYPIEDPWLMASWNNGITRVKLMLNTNKNKVKTSYTLEEII